MTKRTASAEPAILAAIFGRLAEDKIDREAVYLAIADTVRGRNLTATADRCIREAVGAALIAGRLLSSKQVRELGLADRSSSP